MADPAPTSTHPDPPPANLLRPRREPFEYGLLSIPKLVFTDPTPTLSSLRSSLPPCVDPASVADSLQIPPDHASLLLQTLSSVHHLLRPDDDASVADVYDLLLFLYIQSYKKFLPRSHKDSVAVADVWPSTSAFDGYLSALSPLQLVRSNSRRFMPSQANEEAHQLSYLEKHMGNIISLLAEPVDGKGEESLVLTLERFEHLGFLIQFGDKVQEGIPLGQATPFFANSDPDMAPAPVLASQVLDWILQNIAMSLEALSERVSPKENGPANGSDPDVAMADSCTTSAKPSPSSRGVCFIEGISKQSFTKQATDLRGSSVKVLNCHDSAIYIVAPLRYATIYGCSDATIVLGAVGMAVRIEHCERVHVIVAAKRVCIASCRECVFFLGVNQRPLIVGDNHKLQVAPYNTFYPQLEEHMAEVGIKASLNKWDEPLTLGMVDPHDSLSHPAGVSDNQAESATLMDPDQFTNFLIPNSLGGDAVGSTKGNPFPLPVNYKTSQQRRQNSIGEIKQMLRGLMLEDSKKRELASALHVYFKDWLNEGLLHRIMYQVLITLKLAIDALLLRNDIAASGNIRQLYCLQAD